jgi:hypothetical protein
MDGYHLPDPDPVLWVDADAGPVVRPYAVTRGRTQPAGGRFDLISMVVAIRPLTVADVGMGPEHHAIVTLCQLPTSVADLASSLDLPVGIVRVLLGDLHTRTVIATHDPDLDPATMPDDLFEAVINGIRGL